MTDKKIDLTSDAVRSNPNALDRDVSREAEKGTRFREDVDTTKTPEQERNANLSGQGILGATTK